MSDNKDNKNRKTQLNQYNIANTNVLLKPYRALKLYIYSNLYCVIIVIVISMSCAHVKVVSGPQTLSPFLFSYQTL